MTEITLKDYLKDHTQQQAADAIGCTQGAVWQMLRADRDIRFKLNKKGAVASCYEITKPRRKSAF